MTAIIPHKISFRGTHEIHRKLYFSYNLDHIFVVLLIIPLFTISLVSLLSSEDMATLLNMFYMLLNNTSCTTTGHV